MKRVIKFLILIVCTSILVGLSSSQGASVMALPPKEDLPEEILRMQMITAARSPVDGQPLSAGEYAQLQAQLQKVPPPKLDPRIRDQVFLIRLRKTLLQLFPFLDI
ncbi:hypothetical protein [Brasilonema sp. UFV-L1]|uniref:hypothetical protein n=1 Tax=Brasilonema sp. UFV-L1 TaxID=2234130 RepID=UPI00145CF0A2|nr:hypothetical protein [Brasilonema sp. UFV-L1]NMG11805.1 hypothetical protein [Brasilonema sp. UFV-L1]